MYVVKLSVPLRRDASILTFPNASLGLQELLSSAKSMLTNFEHWMDEFSAATPGRIHYSLLVKFLYDWDAYYNAFNTWKTKDSEKLTSNLIAHYMDYERLWNTVKNQANAETEWRPNIVFQQEEIRRKVRNLGSDAAIARLEDSLRQMREMMPTKKDDSELESDSVKGSINDQESGDWSKKENDLTVPPRQVAVSPTSLPSSSINLSPSSGDTDTSLSSSSMSDDAHGSNTSLQKLIQSFGEYGAGFSNEKLAHEIIIDPDFELKPLKRSELEERVRAMATKALLETAREDFERGQYDKWIPGLVKDIKQVRRPAACL
jgi:hypothetical protein